SPVNNHEVSVGDNRAGLILERRRKAFNQIEQSIAARRDVSAVLDIVRRPKFLSRGVVTFVEQRVEGLQNYSVVLLCCLHRERPPNRDLSQSFDPPSPGAGTGESPSLRNRFTCSRKIFACWYSAP